MSDRKKIGILGGTFDPIHMGHLIIAEEAFHQIGLSKVLIMPNAIPPHKKHREGRASDQQRIDMVRLAIQENPHFELFLYEIEQGGLSYSYRTLESLKKANPDTDYYFIIGADSLFDFDTWKNPARIAAACTLVATVRPDKRNIAIEDKIREINERFHTNVILLDTPNIEISSSTIRNYRYAGRGIRYYVPDPVSDYIAAHHIYI